MNKETSPGVSSIASRHMHISAGYIQGLTPEAAMDLAADVRTLAASALGQDETPGQAAKSGSHGIHPAPAEFTAEQIEADPILHFFHYAHLPPRLQETSKAFFLLAAHVVNTVPRTAERTVALRKLLEAKDAAVRANLPAPKKETAVASEAGSENTDDEDQRVIETGGHDIDRDGPVPFDG